MIDPDSFADRGTVSMEIELYTCCCGCRGVLDQRFSRAGGVETDRRNKLSIWVSIRHLHGVRWTWSIAVARVARSAICIGGCKVLGLKPR